MSSGANETMETKGPITSSSTSSFDVVALSKPLDALSLANSASFDPWAVTSSPGPSSPAIQEVREAIKGKPDPVDTSILSEFDPLEHTEDQKAWQEEESHPPPPPSATTKPQNNKSTPEDDPLPPIPDAQSPASISSPPPPPIPKQSPKTSFSPLASIARTFTRVGGDASPSPSHRATDIPDAPSSPTLPRTSNSASPTSPSHINTNVQVTTVEPPFDFQRFLEQLKSKSAEPVAKYLRSFLSKFAKKCSEPFAINDQIRNIQNFLDFIAARMQEVEPWKSCSDAEFDHATEAMEKLVLNRLYDYIFTPLVARAGRSVTTDDLERDQVLTQRIRIFSWIEEKHLEIPPNQEGFVNFAAQELLRINHFKAPRDKLICILNCCKVIFGLIRNARLQEGADAFLPVLIYTVLRANPQHLISNVEYINRFRNPGKLHSEAGYYLSSLMGSISFIETLDFKALSNITQEEFEHNVEEAVQNLSPGSSRSASPTTPNRPNAPAHSGEESARPLSLPTPNFDTTLPFIPPSTPNFRLPQPAELAEDTRRFFLRTADEIANSKAFDVLGKLFGEERESSRDEDGVEHPPRRQSWVGLPGPFAPLGVRESGRSSPNPGPSAATPASGAGQEDAQQVGTYAPYKVRNKAQLSGGHNTPIDGTPSRAPAGVPSTLRPLAMGPSQPQSPHIQSLMESQQASRSSSPALLDIPGISASIASIDAATAKRRDEDLQTLLQIFPSTEHEVLQMVLEACDGDVGVSIERLLEITGT